jgi:hypothetical protein
MFFNAVKEEHYMDGLSGKSMGMYFIMHMGFTFVIMMKISMAK